VRRRRVKASHLCISEECVRPPDAAEHLVADAEFIFIVRSGKIKSRVVPILTEVEVHRKVLHNIFFFLLLLLFVLFFLFFILFFTERK